MEIPKKLKDEFWEYCRLNDVTDIDSFMLKSLQQGFNIEKYGTTPFKIGGEPEVIEKEVIKVITATTEVEVVREVPVEIEVIKEVEKIVEVTVTDNELIDKLQEDLAKANSNLDNILGEKNEEIETLNQKISDLNAEIIQQQEEFSNNNLVKQLKQQLENLKVELELEKNRNYEPPKREKPKDENKRNLRFGNIINWVSRDERSDKEDKDIYGE
jgi:hypothetical protein